VLWCLRSMKVVLVVKCEMGNCGFVDLWLKWWGGNDMGLCWKL